MSQARQANMSKIQVSIQDEEMLKKQAKLDDSLDTRLDAEKRLNEERIKQASLKTQQEVHRLEKAKQEASSSSVKSKLQDEIIEAKRRKEEEDAKRKAQLDTIKVASASVTATKEVGSAVKGAGDLSVKRAQDTLGNVAGTLETVTTPGSIFLPATILIIFFFLLLQVNGMTRAQWLWLSLIGDAKIGASPDATTQPSGQGGSQNGSVDTSGGLTFYGVQYG